MSADPEIDASLTSTASRSAPRAGVIGLGMIGGGVAVSLARRGRPPLVYDVRADAADGLTGVDETALSPAEVASESDVVLVAVVNAAQVRDVLRGDDGVLAGAHPGLIVVLLCTLAVPDVHALATECRDAGVALLDCGVTPGDQAANNGLVAMVGGDDCTVRRALPVLNDFAKKVVHCGPLGAGMAAKIARNVITYGSWRAVHEAAELAEAAGVAPQTLMDLVEEADPQGATLFSWLRHRVATRGSADEFAPSVLALMEKDLVAAQELAVQSAVAVPLVEVARDNGSATLGIPEDAAQDRADRTQLGLSTMGAVYGADLAAAMPQERTPTVEMTIDHLFGEVWSRPGLSIRDRRLLVIGATAALGRADLIETQVRGALVNGEFSEGELEEAVLQLHYYVGWGNGTAVQAGVDAALRNQQRDYPRAEGQENGTH